MPEVSLDRDKKRRFDKRDFLYIGNFIVEEKGRRKNKRKDMETQWKEIDRQIAMTPKTEFKRGKNGEIKEGMAWMPEKELPLQAQTLETLCADARRQQFPDNGPWFRAHSLMSDEYLRRVEFQSLISGNENDVPIKINQDNADKLTEGVMGFVHETGNLFRQIDTYNAEAFKYGTSVGRVRPVQKLTYVETARGMAPESMILPMFFSCSIKNTLLDDRPFYVLHEGQFVGPAEISWKCQPIADLMQAAKKGSNDPYNEDGGWMPGQLKGIDGGKDGNVEVIRWEGDLLVPRSSTEDIFIPNAIVLVVVSESEPRIVRLAFRKKPWSSYVANPYHLEDVKSPYGTSPLMKGEPLQSAATEMFNRLMQAGILNTEPCIQYDPEDPYFVAEGGPVIEPRRLWGSNSKIEVHQIGNPEALMQAYLTCVQHYYDVTGVNAPRLGAQTVSHTTAYAKEVEAQRGQSRTVDYVSSMLADPMSRILDMQFAYLKDVWDETRDVWIPDYGGFCRIMNDAIPDQCVFEIFGSAGPAEKRARVQEQIQAIQLAMQIDQLKVQAGLGQPLDYEAIQKLILKEADFADVDFLFTANTGAPQGQAGPTQGGPGGPGGAQGNPGAQVAALQALGFGSAGQGA